MARSASSTPIFSGEFRHSLDEKNRVTIPARWRGGEQEELFVVKNPQRACLTVLPREVFQQVGELARQNVTPAQHRAFMTQFFSRAKNCPIDKQGRLLLPDDHCKVAGIRTEVVLTGSSDRFELWTPAAWKAFQAECQQTYEQVAEAIGL